MASLELNGINKSYGDTVAVADIDLKIADNKFFCNFGSPGCGKITISKDDTIIPNGMGSAWARARADEHHREHAPEGEAR